MSFGVVTITTLHVYAFCTMCCMVALVPSLTDHQLIGATVDE